MPPLKIATFNVNGIRARLPRLLDWLERETARRGLPAGAEGAGRQRFPSTAIRAAGYGAIWHGQRSWNGVAILARGASRSRAAAACPAIPSDTQSRYLEAAVARRDRRLPVPAQRQPAAGPEVRLQAGLVRAADRARGRRCSTAAIRWCWPATTTWCRPTSTSTTRAPGARTRCCSRKAASAISALLDQGWTDALAHAASGRARSTPSGIISASTGNAMPGCASITCCSTTSLTPRLVDARRGPLGARPAACERPCADLDHAGDGADQKAGHAQADRCRRLAQHSQGGRHPQARGALRTPGWSLHSVTAATPRAWRPFVC